MAEWAQPQAGVRPFGRALPLGIALVAVAVFASWLLGTPEGVLGKADAVGYAICHRIESHSFVIGGRQLPLCARCSGIYLGALLGVVTLVAAGRTRAGQLPPPPLLATLAGFVAVMGIDGVNSYLTFFPGLPHLYEPQNALRLVTGALHGLALAAILYPLFNGVAWRAPEDAPSLRNFRELLGLITLAGIVVALVLTEDPAVLYPLAILSALGVVLMLSLVNTIVVMYVARRDNRATSWRGLWPLALAGLALTFVEIGLIDVVRFALTGTWAGFVL
jgi:uncharacterized membrane protein